MCVRELRPVPSAKTKWRNLTSCERETPPGEPRVLIFKLHHYRFMRKLLTIFVAVLLCTASVGGTVDLQTRTHAIIEMSEGCLIGGARNQKWIDADHFPKPLKKSLPVSIYTLKGLEGQFTLSVSRKSECHDYWTSNESEHISSGIAIERPSWNVMPRMPRPIDLQDTTYVAIVRDVLRSAGIKKPEVKITQGYKIDLDGDGKDEVVLAANRYVKGAQELTGFSAGTEPGDYTLVLVRKIVGESVRNIFLVKAVWLKENEGPLPRGNHISAIADLNGDGTMEIVLYSAYFEGSDSDVVQIRGTRANTVLECGCDH